MDTIAVTGATGQLGRLVLAGLAQAAPYAQLVGLVRDRARAADLAAAGVELRVANYDDPASVTAALQGADKVLLISSSELGRRAAQHRAVIAAAQRAGVGLLAYTSLLHADTTPLTLGLEHRETEADLRALGVPFVLLRNGWYTENYTAGVAAALKYGVVLGSAGTGRISSATRADYASAAVAVLAHDAATEAGRTYELAGDASYTLAEYASEIARQSGVAVSYRDLPEADYAAALVQAGLPPAFAQLLAESDAKAADGALFDDSGTLGRLIGRPTTPLAEAVRQALATTGGQ
jgi:NAD(P)H dehydrogenase (quinone)